MSLMALLGSWLRGPGPGHGQPRCARCGEPILGSRFLALGREWHPAHFCCGVCGRPLEGRFLLSWHQEPFCAGHRELEPICHGCGHLVPGGAGPGGFCPGCRAGILGDGEAAALLVSVQGLMRAEGLPWWPQSFPVRLVGPEELQAAGPAPGPALAGRISTRTTADAQGRPVRTVQEIRLLRGRPALMQGAVLAHELGHAYLFQKGLGSLPPDLEEGFCEFWAHRWLARSRDPRAPFLMDRLARNEDPVYGGGFRKVQDLAAGPGLPGLLARLESLSKGKQDGLAG